MFKRIQQILAPPIFPEDENKTRVAAQLYTILWTMGISSSLYLVLFPFIAPQLLNRLVLIIPLFPLLIGLWFLVYFGRVRLASFGLVIGMWAVLIFAAAASGGVSAPGFSGCIVMILCAGLLLGQREAMGIAGITILIGLLLVYAENQHWLPPRSTTNSALTVWAAQSVFFVVASGLLHLAINSIQDALTRSQQELYERQQAEQKLRSSEERFRAMVENISEVIALVDRAGTLLYVSPTSVRITGYTPQERIGKNGFDTVYPDDLAYTQQKFQQIQNQPNSQATVELRVSHKDGHWQWIEITGHNLLDNPSIAAIVLNYRDITERKQAEFALRESETRYRFLYNHTPAMLFSLDPQGHLLNVSDYWLHTLGYKRHEVIQHHLSHFLKDESSQNDLQTIFPQLAQSGRCQDIPCRFLKKNGQIADILFSAAAEQDEKGQVVCYIAVLTDVTERNQLEEQLRQAQKMEAIGQLAGGIAHDFNNILTAVISYSDILLYRHPSTQDPDHKSSRHIKQASERAASLIRQLLAFSRQQVLQPSLLNLNHLVLTVMEMLQRLIKKEIELIFVLAEDLGQVRVDQVQLEQVILNLVINAQDAMPAGGKLTIVTDNFNLAEWNNHRPPQLALGSYVQLTVKDSGIGMDSITQSRIFEPFFTTKVGGTGLGLAMVHGIVKQSGGYIQVVSELGKGTAFDIYLPRVELATLSAIADLHS